MQNVFETYRKVESYSLIINNKFTYKLNDN